jgi:hypothetical protein
MGLIQRMCGATRLVSLRTHHSAARVDADVAGVPDQCDFIVKNTATLALQLQKRFRNIRYASYSGRIPRR